MNAFLAAAGAACGAMAAVELVSMFAQPRALAAVSVLVGPASAAGTRGREASAADRLRLSVLFAIVAAVLAWSLLGPVAGALAPVVAAGFTGGALRIRRRRWRAAMRAGSGAAARAIGDAASAGLPAIAAIQRAALDGAVPEKVATELMDLATRCRLGLSLEDGLEELRARVDSAQWDALTAAIRLQREVGGDLSRILSGLASGLEEASRSQQEARSLSSQARLTARIVVSLPIAGLVISEIASPGMIGAMLSGPLSRLLVAVAILLQAVAAVSVRRIARLGVASG